MNGDEIWPVIEYPLHGMSVAPIVDSTDYDEFRTTDERVDQLIAALASKAAEIAEFLAVLVIHRS